MAASDHIQLRMFMPARELRALTSSEVGDALPAWRTHEEMWADKKQENDVEGGLSEDVAKYGVEHPVRLSHGGSRIDTGHHRIQAAYDADPESLVPVTHKREN